MAHRSLTHLEELVSAITDHFRSVSHNTSVLCVVLDMRQSLQRLVIYEGYLVCGKRLTDQASSGMDVKVIISLQRSVKGCQPVQGRDDENILDPCGIIARIPTLPVSEGKYLSGISPRRRVRSALLPLKPVLSTLKA